MNHAPRRSLLVVLALLLVVAGCSAPQDLRTHATAESGTRVDELPSRTFGGLEGLSLTVSPQRDLADGDLVRVQVDGGDQLVDPIVVQCAGDVSAATATYRCDPRALETANAGATVTVRRVISISAIGTTPTRYDCATQPAGCVLAVGETSPIRGVAVPLDFSPGAVVGTPEVSVGPADSLEDGQVVALTGRGFRPNSSHRIVQCSTVDPGACDLAAAGGARSDADGTLRAEVPVAAALYGYRGRVDCTTTSCELSVVEDLGGRLAGAAISFAEHVRAPTPALVISPEGPYADGQRVTVRGSGFPAGEDVAGRIGRCPNGKDTAVEERCVYPSIVPTVVDDDGSFEVEIVLRTSSVFAPACDGPPGCHLGWVIPKGPTMAITPIEFR